MKGAGEGEGLHEALGVMTAGRGDPTLTHAPVKFASLCSHSKLLQNGRISAKGSAKGDCEVQHTWAGMSVPMRLQGPWLFFLSLITRFNSE